MISKECLKALRPLADDRKHLKDVLELERVTVTRSWKQYAGAAMGDLLTAYFTSDEEAASGYLETALSNLYVAIEAIKAELAER